MDELQVFSISGAWGRSGQPQPFRTEAELRRFVVQHAMRLLGVRIVASEFLVDRNGGGRIDAIGIDAKCAPVVIEFKRTASGLTICQALYYLDWLDRHREVFSALVLRRRGKSVPSHIAWEAARLLCIAEVIGSREEAVARQIGRAVELLQVQRYSRGVVTIQRARSSTEGASRNHR
jgi:hypothetical protein